MIDPVGKLLLLHPARDIEAARAKRLLHDRSPTILSLVRTKGSPPVLIKAVAVGQDARVSTSNPWSSTFSANTARCSFSTSSRSSGLFPVTSITPRSGCLSGMRSSLGGSGPSLRSSCSRIQSSGVIPEGTDMDTPTWRGFGMNGPTTTAPPLLVQGAHYRIRCSSRYGTPEPGATPWFPGTQPDPRERTGFDPAGAQERCASS